MAKKKRPDATAEQIAVMKAFVKLAFPTSTFSVLRQNVMNPNALDLFHFHSETTISLDYRDPLEVSVNNVALRLYNAGIKKGRADLQREYRLLLAIH